MTNQSAKRPDVIDWGIVGENAAIRQVNTRDPVDLERYWITNRSVGQGLMVDDIETMEELIENARDNGQSNGYTLAISGIWGDETGEFQGFVQFTHAEILRRKIEETGLFHFRAGVQLWEVSYARYPASLPHQVASAVRQACVWLLLRLRHKGLYPRLAILGATDPQANPDSLRVLAGACFDPLSTLHEEPRGMVRYEESSTALDAVWLLNWNRLHHKLRQRAAPGWEARDRSV